MIPSITHRRWRELILQPDPFRLEWLPLRILLSRIKIDLHRDSSEASIWRCIADVHGMLTKQEKLAERDLAKIFKQERQP